MSTSLVSSNLASSLLDNLENPKTSCFRPTKVAANRNMLDGGNGMYLFLQQSYFLSSLKGRCWGPMRQNRLRINEQKRHLPGSQTSNNDRLRSKKVAGKEI